MHPTMSTNLQENSTQVYERPLLEIATQATVLSVICLTSVIGNGLVAVIVYFDHRLHKPTFFFIVSLSLADIIAGVVYVPFYTVSVVRQKWDFSNSWCKGHAATVSLSFNASLITLAFVSLDRYLAITKPLRYQTLLTTKRAAKMIAMGWGHSVIWAAAPLVGWGEITFDPKTCICRPNWAATGLPSRIYALLLALLAFAVPTITMIYCYYKIFRVARHQVQLIRQNSVSAGGNVTDGGQLVNEKRALKTILLVIGAFLVAWLPYTILSMLKLFTRYDASARAANGVLTVTLINGCINPLIYSLKDKRFNNGMRKLLCPCVKVAQQDDFTSAAATTSQRDSNLEHVTRNEGHQKTSEL